MFKFFKVFHSRNWSLNTLLHFGTEGYVPLRKDYELVADVQCENLADVFYFTNTVDRYWWEHSNVTAFKIETRSTSVGDLVEDEDGQLWVCASCGWEKVEWGDDSNDSLRKQYNFWKPVYDKFNDVNAKAKMDAVLNRL